MDAPLARDLVANAGVLRVLDDADEFDRRLRTGIDPDPYVVADRGLGAEIMRRVALVDDSHTVRRRALALRIARLVDRVALGEVAAEDERNPHRLEVARADRVAERVHVLARLCGVAFDCDRTVP